MSSSPHDALFKAIFSEPAQARAELEPLLPSTLATQIDWASLRLVPGSFVDEALGRSESDLLFEARTTDGGAVRVYLLFEHQSTVDRWMPFRLLHYAMRIWGRDVAAGAPALVPIVSVVLHHSQAGWTAGVDFDSVLELGNLPDEVLPYLPRFRFVLDDVSARTDDDLAARTSDVIVRLTLATLREARRSDDAFALIRRLGRLLRDVLSADGGAAAYVRVLRYLLSVSEPADARAFLEAVGAEVGAEGKEVAMTFMDVIQARGREEGRRELLVQLLENRFGSLAHATRERIARMRPAAVTEAVERLAAGETDLESILG